MVLVHLPAKPVDFVWANVGRYSMHGAYGLDFIIPGFYGENFTITNYVHVYVYRNSINYSE